MRGGNGHRPAAGQRQNGSAGKRSAFDRVRPSPQLVQQDEGRLVSVEQDRSEGSDVGTEGRQAGGDGLVVADVREDVLEHGKQRPRSDWRDHAGLRQGADEAHRLDEHGLAAGIRPAHHNRAGFRTQDQIKRHRVARLCDDEGVTALPDLELRWRGLQPG